MDSDTTPGSDVLKAHDHEKLSAEEISKAVARHNKAHKGAPKDANPKDANPKAAQKKSGKR